MEYLRIAARAFWQGYRDEMRRIWVRPALSGIWWLVFAYVFCAVAEEVFQSDGPHWIARMGWIMAGGCLMGWIQKTRRDGGPT